MQSFEAGPEIFTDRASERQLYGDEPGHLVGLTRTSAILGDTLDNLASVRLWAAAFRRRGGRFGSTPLRACPRDSLASLPHAMEALGPVASAY